MLYCLRIRHLLCIRADSLADVPHNLADMNRRLDFQSPDIVNLVRMAMVRTDCRHLFAQVLKWFLYAQKMIDFNWCKRIKKNKIVRRRHRFAHAHIIHDTSNIDECSSCENIVSKCFPVTTNNLQLFILHICTHSSIHNISIHKRTNCRLNAR